MSLTTTTAKKAWNMYWQLLGHHVPTTHFTMLTRSMIQAATFGVAVGDGLQNLKFDMPFTGMEAIFRWLGDWNTTWPDASSSADGPGVHSLSQPWPFVDTSKLPYGGTTSVSSAFMGTGVTIVGEVKGSLSSSSNEMSLTLNNDYRSVPLPVNSSIIASGNLAAPAPATMSFSVDQGQLLITIKAIILTMVMSSEAWVIRTLWLAECIQNVHHASPDPHRILCRPRQTERLFPLHR